MEGDFLFWLMHAMSNSLSTLKAAGLYSQRETGEEGLFFFFFHLWKQFILNHQWGQSGDFCMFNISWGIPAFDLWPNDAFLDGCIGKILHMWRSSCDWHSLYHLTGLECYLLFSCFLHYQHPCLILGLEPQKIILSWVVMHELQVCLCV